MIETSMEVGDEVSLAAVRSNAQATAYGVVLGCPRSGTTYLMDLLDTVPDLECVTGNLLPVAIPYLASLDLPFPVLLVLALGFQRALDDYLESGLYHSRAAALQKWISAPTGLRGLLRAVRGERDLPHRVIYKEPFLSLAPEFVWEALPDARIVHIYRDGRDAANSLVRTYDVLTDDKLTHWQTAEMRIGRGYDHRFVPCWVEEGREAEFMESTPYVRAIWMWKHMVRRCYDFFSRPEVRDSGRVLLLRYEDLASDTSTWGRAVVEHFGVEPKGATLRMMKQAHTDSIGKYKRRDPAEVRAAERIAGDELALYGYL